VAPYFIPPDAFLGRQFGDVVTVRIAEALRRLDNLRVLAPSTSLSKEMRHLRLAPLSDVRERLGVDYFLKGQIARQDQRLTFMHQLYDMRRLELLDTFELHCEIDRLFELEHEVLARVASEVMVPLREAETERIEAMRARDHSAYECVVLAQIALNRLSRRSFERARTLLRKALAIDPENASALAWHARYHSLRIGQGWARDRNAEASEAKRLAALALRHEPANALARATAGHLTSYLHKDYATAERLLAGVVESCPNEPLGWLFLATTQAYTGQTVEARRNAAYALSLSPLDSMIYSFHSFASIAHWAAGDFASARHHAQLSVDLNPNYSSSQKVLAASLVGLGEIERAREVGAIVRRLDPGYRKFAAATVPFSAPDVRELFLRQVRTAGCLDP